MRNHYENLKVPRTASPEEIKNAYRKLRSTHHPDRNTDPRSTQRMQIINDAWDVLSDTHRRAKHDAEIARAEAFEDFIREMEEKVVDEEFVSTEEWEDDPADEPEDTEKIEAMQRFFEIRGELWVRESRYDTTYSKVDPTYRVYRTDFIVGSKTYYYYACYKSELVNKWHRIEKELGSTASQYGSGTLSPRLVNQQLMDVIFDNKGVLWSEGEPAGDVTAPFFRKG